MSYNGMLEIDRELLQGVHGCVSEKETENRKTKTTFIVTIEKLAFRAAVCVGGRFVNGQKRMSYVVFFPQYLLLLLFSSGLNGPLIA